MTPQELAQKVLEHIKANPENWDQSSWGYYGEWGIIACAAGWAVILADVYEYKKWLKASKSEGTLDLEDFSSATQGVHVRDAAEKLLNLNREAGSKIFVSTANDSQRSREFVLEALQNLVNSEPGQESEAILNTKCR